MQIERNRPCPDCGGKGTKNSSDIKTCPSCNGSGYIRRRVQTLLGFGYESGPCPQCSGSGKVVTNPCRRCGGSGLERRRESVSVEIPAGVEEGMQLTKKGEGHAARGGENGDLLIVIREQAHPQLRRDGNNLFYTTVISVMDAILGAEISVPTLDGPTRLKIDPGTQSGTVQRLRGKGLPAVRGYGNGTGDLYVKINVWVPRKLSRSEKEQLESLRHSSSFTPDLSRDDKQIFEKTKNIF